MLGSGVGDPGLNFAPWPVVTYEKVQVTGERTTDIGTVQGNADSGLMLTRDQNIVDIGFQVVWNISDPEKYLFNLADPEITIRAVSASAMRDIIARSELSPILNRDRGLIADTARENIQATLNEYDSGISIVRVNLDKADPPSEVIDAFREVQAAEQERDRLQRTADAYANRVLAEARGQAAQNEGNPVVAASRRAGERVLEGLRKLYNRLHLKVNEAKTAVAPVSGRKFLGYAFWYGRGGQVKCKVADKAKETFKQRIRQMTRRSGGRSLPEIAEQLRTYMPGWKAYFQLAQTPQVFRELDKWLRHRLRAVQLKHWRRGTTMYRELLALGASEADARKVAANSRCWWRNSRLRLNRAMPIAYFDRLGVPRLS